MNFVVVKVQLLCRADCKGIGMVPSKFLSFINCAGRQVCQLNSGTVTFFVASNCVGIV